VATKAGGKGVQGIMRPQVVENEEEKSIHGVILEVRGVDVHFTTRAGTAHVLNDMGFACERGQMIGLVGESGSGKTVLAGVLVNNIRRPGRISGGHVIYKGHDLLKVNEEDLQPIRGREIGMVVAKSSTALNPLVCVGDQIANIYQSHFEVSKEEAKARVLAAIAATGINDPDARFRSFPHELSGGMAKRVVIAAALVCEPTFLIADEPTSGLDVTIQAQVLDSMMDLIGQMKTAGTLLMTRDLGIIAQYCTRVIVTYAGQVVEQGSVEGFFQRPLHPYSKLLLASARLNTAPARRFAKMGPPPDKFKLPDGCLFRARCLVADGPCQSDRPPLLEVEPGHLLRCWKGEALS